MRTQGAKGRIALSSGFCGTLDDPAHLHGTPGAATRGGDASPIQGVRNLLGAGVPAGANVFDDGHQVFVSLGYGFATDGGAGGISLPPILFMRSTLPRWPPSATPRAFAAVRAAFVRVDIIAASCSATAARMCTVRRLAWGKSTAMKSTPLSIREEMK